MRHRLLAKTVNRTIAIKACSTQKAVVLHDQYWTIPRIVIAIVIRTSYAGLVSSGQRDTLYLSSAP
jgi:hypothetical protein